MSYLKPAELAEVMVETGAAKTGLSVRDTLIRSYMVGAILALAAAFAVTIAVDTGSFLIGALLFPVGFCMLSLLGFDLLTGVFTLVPFAVLAKRPGCTVQGMLRTWGLVFIGNFAGALTTAFFIATILTMGFTQEPGAVGDKLRQIGHARTVGYAEAGFGGIATLFIRAVMCNWMVSTGVVAALMSTSVPGKVIGMWMPILIFFYLGFEHSVVNMFLFPSGLILGSDFTWFDYMMFNELPTVLGNLVGGITFVGATIYMTYYRGSDEAAILPDMRSRSDTKIPNNVLAAMSNGARAPALGAANK